jgi:uncharacterized protein YecT (DUF1311 family)
VRYILVAVFVVLGSLSCYSQESAQFKACTNKEETQTGLDRCADEEATRTNAELGRTYQKLKLLAKEIPGATEKIENAERAWIQYRDAYLVAMYPLKDKQANYGTIYPMDFALLRAELTQAQTMRLKELIKQYGGEGQ